MRTRWGSASNWATRNLATPTPQGLFALDLFQRAATSISAIVLVVANLVPLYGVLALGWDLGFIMLLFWFESAVVGLFNLAKMGLVGGPRALGLMLFFLIHYGFFMFIHLVFLLLLFVGPNPLSSDAPPRDPFELPPLDPTLTWGALALIVSHGFSFAYNFLGHKEYHTATLQGLMGAPYGRVVIMQLTIIFGGMTLMAFRSPSFALGLLVPLKVVVDLGAHLWQHRTQPAVAPTPSPPGPNDPIPKS